MVCLILHHGVNRASHYGWECTTNNNKNNIILETWGRAELEAAWCRESSWGKVWGFKFPS